MAKEVSVVFKAEDKLSGVIKEMKKNVDGLSQDIKAYEKLQQQVFDQKIVVKLDAKDAKKEMDNFQKSIKENAKESAKMLESEQKKVDNLGKSYQAVKDVVSGAPNAEGQFEKDNVANNKNLKVALGETELVNNLLNSVNDNYTQTMSSMFGSQKGGAIGGVVTGMASGAAMGLSTGTGIHGAAIGAVLGGLTSAINALTEHQRNRDERFRDEVKSLYDLAKQEQKESLNKGIGLASTHEQNKIKLNNVLDGTGDAETLLKEVESFKSKVPFQMESLLNMTKSLSDYGYKQEEILPILNNIGEATLKLGMNDTDMQLIASSLGNMKNTNTLAMEDLEPFIQKGIPAIDYLAEKLEKSKEQVEEMVNEGLIPGVEASETIARALGEDFKGNIDDYDNSYEGLSSMLEARQAEMDEAMGRGYTEKRKEGMAYELEQLTGEGGEKLKEANELIGTYYAELENKHQQAITDAMTSAAESVDYLSAEKINDQAKMGEILEEARVKAEIDYKNSVESKAKANADIDLVNKVQQAVHENGAYLRYGEAMAEEFSKGWYGIFTNTIGGRNIKLGDVYAMGLNNQNSITSPQKQPYTGPMPYVTGEYATGLDRVPYDNMLAYLHEGERVLTKVEADKLDNGQNNRQATVNITVNNTNGTPYDITKEICNQIMRASESFVGGVA